MSRLISYRQLKSLYTRSPEWVQHAYATLPFSWRAGSVYRKTRQLIDETDQLPWEELQRRQLQRLSDLLRHASAHVPFYRETFRQSGFTVPDDSLDLSEEFQSMPLMEKHQLQSAPQRFHATGGVGEAVYHDNTGGSSGTPFEFLKNNSMYPLEQAYMMSQWARMGYQPGDRKLTLRGRTFSGRSTNERWAVNPIYNELALSSYHLDAETITASLDVVKRFCPEFLHGYPSAIVTYLRGIKEAGLTMPCPIRAVFCGSEPTYDYQREYITQTLGCRVYSWYGQSECVILAGECDKSQEYHSFPLYGLMELINDDGTRITDPGIEGEIVGTSLNNWAMPFIRYRTGDRGIYADRQMCECGRNYPRLKQVTGRKQHFIYTVNRRAVPVTALIFGQHFDAFRRICALQLVQEEPGRLAVRVVRGDEFSEADERELRDKIQASVDHEICVEFEYVDALEVNGAGKTDFVIQHVKDEAC